MRVTEKYKKKGEFWVDINPSKKFKGTLCIENGGSALLKMEVNGHISNRCKRILGKLANGRDIQLEECRFVGEYANNEVHQYKYKPKRVIEGSICSSNYNDIKINTFIFSIDGLRNFIKDTGVLIEYKGEEKIYKYKQINEFTYQIPNNMQLSFLVKPFFSHNIDGTTKATCINEKIECKLYSKQSRGIEEFRELASKIILFFCFIMDETVCMKDVILKSYKFPKEESFLFYESYPFKKEEKKLYWSLLEFEKIKDNFGLIMNKWLEIIDKTKPALYLYLLPKSMDEKERYIQDIFSNLMQVSEAYCQRFYPEYAGKNFLDIITKMFQNIMEEYCPANSNHIKDNQYSQVFNAIKRTRDYVIHYNPKKKSDSMKEQDIDSINGFIDGLLQIKILQDLNMDSSIIKELSENRSNKLKGKLHQLGWVDWSEYKDN